MTRVEKRGLGRGLSALISPTAVAIATEPEETIVPSAAAAEPEPHKNKDDVPGESGQVRYVEIKDILNNPSQPRQTFSEEELEELSTSIRSLGILQPVLLRRMGSLFEIVAGERRWRAAQRAGLTTIPAIVRDLDDRDTLQIALVENVQRQQLNPVEEALGYDRLMHEFGYTQEQVADLVGKSRASVANFLRLLKLAPEVLDLLKEDEISMGHAKAILSVRDHSAQISLARKVVAEELSVRALELLVSRVVVLDSGKAPASSREKAAHSAPSPSAKPEPVFPEIVDRLREKLGTRVAIHHSASGKGKIEIEYFSEEDLDRLLDLISPRNDYSVF